MKILLSLVGIAFILYTLLCAVAYFAQEKLIFFPERLDKNFRFDFAEPFEEQRIRVDENVALSALYFKANPIQSDSSKGVIFYLHGNAGSLRSWGEVAKTYTDLGYNVFMVDYRGYGKSDGMVTSEAMLFQDLQIVYDSLKKRRDETHIIVLGYSVGTGLAAKVASANNPKRLILQAPYYSLVDMKERTTPFLPTMILKYKVETAEFLKECRMPVTIFHGERDEVIPFQSSVMLSAHFKAGDTLIALRGQGHNGMTTNPDYKREIEKILK
jgi:uncharacterized protein